MPGFSLEEPFPLARFHTTIGSSQLDKHFVVGLTQLETTTSAYDKSDAGNNTDTHRIAITVQGEGVKLYNTNDQKCLKSWTTPPGVVFAEPAKHRMGTNDADALEHTYAIVATGPDMSKEEECKTVWIWKNTSSSEANETKITKSFEHRIQSIHLSPTLNLHVILVNENGSINIVSKDLDRLTATYKESSEVHVVWSTIFVTSNAHVRPCCIPNTMLPGLSTVIMTVSNTPGSDVYTVRMFYMNEERRSVDLLAKIDMKHNEIPIAFTFDSVDGKMTTMGASGTWTVWRIYMKHGSANKISAHLTRHSSVQLQGYCFYDETLGNVASLTSLSDSYVAMVAPRMRKNTEPEHVVSVWDVKYGTLQAEQVITGADKGISAKDKCVYKISVLSNSQLAITISKVDSKTTKSGKTQKTVMDAKSVVIICPYYCEPMSLMAAMGKMRSTVEFLGVQQDAVGLMRSGVDAVGRSVVSARYKEDDALFTKWVTKQELTQTDEQRIMAKLLKKDLSVDKFTTLFMNYVQTSAKESGYTGTDEDTSMEEENLHDTTNPMSLTKAYREEIARYQPHIKSEHEISYHFVSCVISKIFSCQQDAPDLEFWPVKVLLFLLAKRRLHSSYIEGGLISALLKRDAWALIPIVLEQVNDIPETDLVLIIKALVEKHQSQPTEWSSLFSSYMKTVIDSPHNDIFMQQALKQLTPTELPVMLETLLSWLEKDAQPVIEENNSTVAIETPIHDNTLEISSAILDIHFPTVILETSMHETVKKLSTIVQKEAELAGKLEELRAILGPFTRKHQHQLARWSQNKQHTDAPTDDLSKARRAHKGGRFGGEQGIPVYRVESFRF
ncbi:hypothetical protein BDF14DRAFT_1778373 [Spinellus fusiger]|nr:hypothetical protein BDF14DRAFT_1778373 [Spinellus fusiger]